MKICQQLERRIVRRVVTDMLAAGYSISVDNGGDEWEIKRSTDQKAIMKACMASDEDWMYFYKGNFRKGWVRFVYGNSGYDVICDYTTSLEENLKAVNAYAETLWDKYN